MSSPFAIRGVIEGFYGNPWTHAQRLGAVRFIGARGMNTFVYGPKGDALLRVRWRESYGDEELARLAELVAVGVQAGVEIVYAISPGLSIRYASAADHAALLAKLEQVATLGVTQFALLLDDLPVGLAHDVDRAAFADIEEAHAALAAIVAAGLGPSRTLLVCGLVYHGRGDEPYLARLGAELDPRVDLCWTGRAICSPVLELDDARRFERTARRPPLYWDNYPVNDLAMSWELHIGPYRGRDATLHEAARGILANPMELAEASMIPLATIADYLTDPAAYDPEASFARAIRDVAGDGTRDGGHDAAAFALFADNVRGSCLTEDDAPAVAGALAAFAAAAHDAAQTGDTGPLSVQAAALGELAGRMLAAAGLLLRGPVANPALVDDCRPWLETFELGARAMCRVADLAAEGRLPGDREAVIAELLPYLAELRQRRVRVFGDALDLFLADATTVSADVRSVRTLPAQGAIE